MMRSAEIHARIGAAWPHVLEQLGIDAAFLRNRHGPCPACGGRDRFRFTNRDQTRGLDTGSWYCNACGGRDRSGGAGDGFALLERVYGWSFAEARRRVMQVAGLEDRVDLSNRTHAPSPALAALPAPSGPPRRALDLLRTSCAIADCEPAIRYLQSRAIWPLPRGTTLRAHAGAEYWDEGRCIGRFPALVAPLVDLDGELLAVHATYVPEGRKLEGHAPRKLHGKLGRLADRRGLAVRLMPLDGEVLGIAEGLETAIAASLLHDVPCWAALTAGLLEHFQPPPGVHRVLTFADRDVAGLQAAYGLREQLDGRAIVELRTPPAPFKDWNDVLIDRYSPPP